MITGDNERIWMDLTFFLSILTSPSQRAKEAWFTPSAFQVDRFLRYTYKREKSFFIPVNFIESEIEMHTASSSEKKVAQR